MANKRQANINRNLIAGVPQTIEMGCEFVFIDVGRDLTVIADSTRLTNRQAGDELRFDEPVKSVTLESAVDQTVELVMGYGHYNRLIVQGDVVANAGVLGLDRIYRSDTRVKKGFSFDLGGSLNGISVTRGDVYPLATNDGIYFRGAGIHEGVIYHNDGTNIRGVPVEGGWSESFTLMKVYYSAGNYIDNYFNWSGEHWGFSNSTQNILKKWNGSQWVAENELPFSVSLNRAHAPNDDVLYICSGNVNGGVSEGVFKYTRSTNELVRVLSGGYRAAIESEGLLYATENRLLEVYNAESMQHIETINTQYSWGLEQSPNKNLIGFYKGRLLQVEGDIIWRGLSAILLDTETLVSGKVSEGNVGGRQKLNNLLFVDTDFWGVTRANVSTVNDGGRIYLTGEVIKFILQYRYGDKIKDDYLDHVYGISITNGDDLSTGTKSFALSGVEDSFTVPAKELINITVDRTISA